jgi:hypothetical protein
MEIFAREFLFVSPKNVFHPASNVNLGRLMRIPNWEFHKCMNDNSSGKLKISFSRINPQKTHFGDSPLMTEAL